MTSGMQDKKKLAILAVLIAVAAYLTYSNVIAGPEMPQGASPAGSLASPPVSNVTLDSAPPARRAPSRARNEEFHPVLHSRRSEDRLDPSSLDPTLRLDLFAKVQKVELAGGSRNLFQFATAPPPKASELPKEPKIVPRQVVAVMPPPAAPPSPPPPPPITLKFYGFSTTRNSGKRTAYFLDGDEILSAAEGEILKRRYKVLKITTNSVLMEDTDAKRQESVPLVEESQS
jgi:hypothetical protein